MSPKGHIDEKTPLGERLDSRKEAHSASEFRRRAESLGFSGDEIDTLLRLYGTDYPLEPPTRR
ncbi:MAG: hypothetical protein AAFP99_04805 [Pseudomonadota bacterium]